MEHLLYIEHHAKYFTFAFYLIFTITHKEGFSCDNLSLKWLDNFTLELFHSFDRQVFIK